MSDKTIKYFAYGSNMQTQRLQGRCPSATPLGVGYVLSHHLSFSKKGKDSSGKATLLKSTNKTDIVYGVVFEIKKSELKDLDKAEYNYIRDDDFTIIFNKKPIKVITYYILDSEIEIGLLPMDWYKEFCVKGAKQHGIDADYVQKLENLITHPQP